MIVKVYAKSKGELVKGKKYIGAGLYKDGEVVWELSREGKDWVIRKKGSGRSMYRKGYWDRVLSRAIGEKGVLLRSAVKVLKAFVSEDSIEFESNIDLVVDDRVLNVNTRVNKDEVDGKYVIVISGEVDGEEFEVSSKLPEEIGLMLDAFEPDEVVEIIEEVVKSEDFAEYVLGIMNEELNLDKI